MTRTPPSPPGAAAACRGARLGAAVLAALALAAALSACGGRLKLGAGKEGETVDAEGWAPVDPANPLAAKEAALAAAQRKAVEKVAGVFISAKTRVEAAVTLDQRILANTGGYIRRYEVLGERVEGGFHKTRIRALVMYRKLGDDLRSLGLSGSKTPPGNPKVAVVVRAKGGGEAAKALGARASEAVRKGLMERGFSVLDLVDQPLVRVASTDTVTAASAGAALKADLMVAGEAEAYELRDPRLGDFHSFRARVTLQAVKPGTGEVVAVKTQEASGIDPAAEIAAVKAVENAGYLAGSAVAAEVASALKSRVAVALRVRGLGGFDRLGQFADDLRLYPDVEEASLSSFRDGVAEFSVVADEMAGDALAALILQMRKYRFAVRTVTPFEVEVEGN